MKVTINRCRHCLRTYHYQASGHMDIEDCLVNDKEYCPVCKKAINDALSNVPIAVMEVYEETNEITLDELIKIEKEQKEIDEKNHRYSFKLYSLSTCIRVVENGVLLPNEVVFMGHEVVGYTANDRHYLVEMKNDKCKRIYVAKEYDLKTNKVIYYWS